MPRTQPLRRRDPTVAGQFFPVWSNSAQSSFVSSRPDDESFPSESERKSKGKRGKKDGEYIPRPPNSFILFACKYREEATRREGESKDNRILSRDAAMAWKSLSQEEKAEWERRAAIEKERHAEEHPDYRYRPRRRDIPRHPRLSSEEKNDSGIAFLPPNTSLLPRKLGRRPRRNESTQLKITGERSMSVQSTSDGSHTGQTDDKPWQNSKAATGHFPQQILPAHTHISSTPSAGPSSQHAGHQEADNDLARFLDQMTKHPQQIEPPRLSYEPLPGTSVEYSTWNPAFFTGTADNAMGNHNPGAGIMDDTTLSYTQFGAPSNFSGHPCFTSGAPYPPFDFTQGYNSGRY